MSKRKGDPGYAAGWCIHYRGITGRNGESITSCEKGVEYSTFKENGTGFTHRAPCFLTDKGDSKPDAMPCEHLRRPTQEEIAQHEFWFDERMKKQIAVMTGIASWREKHRGKSAAEIVECPACKGKLHLSIAACNGHVHGQCETTDCVAWME